MKKLNTLNAAVLVALVAMTGLTDISAHAASAKEAKAGKSRDKDVPAAIQKMIKDNGVTVIDTFKGAGGLTTYVMEAEPGDRRMFYVLPGGKQVALGIVFNENLDNLSTADVKRMHEAKGKPGAKPTAAPTAPVAAAGAPFAVPPASVANMPSHQASLNDAHARMVKLDDVAFVEGRGADVYIVFDPSCPYCHRLYKDTRDLLGKLRLHWVPVANISQNSWGLMQALYESKNMSNTMAEIADKKASASMNPPGEKARRAHNEANIVLAAAGSTGVPILLYVNNGVVQHYIGAPKKEQLDALALTLSTPSRR